MDQKSLYTEIIKHYQSCEINLSGLSDTWIHTLKQRESILPFDLMLTMFAPGNPANFLIDSRHYLIDPSVLNLTDPVVQILLKAGESDFGAPRKDIHLQGKTFSSDYLHHIIDATNIIHFIHERNITQPIIMEIGGGLGAVAQLLKIYFQDKLTLVMVDLPEILLYQEWYLRASFPHAKTSFKGSKKNVSLVHGGLNFINAYVLLTQDIPIDVIINIDSMQEMKKETVTTYIHYIEKNCKDHGFFYTQNQFGMSAASLPEPTEYDLNEYWSLRSAELAYQIETCSESEQARFIFFKRQTKEDIHTRRLILRIVWNGLLTGRIKNKNPVISVLSQIPKWLPLAKAIPQIKQTLDQYQIPFSHNEIQLLKSSPLLKNRDQSFFYCQHSNSSDHFTQKHAESIAASQSRLIQEIKEHKKNLPSIQKQLAQIAMDNLLELKGTESSEFWTACMSPLLNILGYRKQSEQLIKRCHEQSSNPFWQMRLSYLLLRFNFIESAKNTLRSIKMPSPPDYYLELRLAELEHQLDLASQAHDRLEKIITDKKIIIPEPISFIKTAIKLEQVNLARTQYQLLSHALDQQNSLDFILQALRNHGPMIEFANELFQYATLSSDSSDPYTKLMYTVLKQKLHKQYEPKELHNIITVLPDNYYLLAQIGRLLQEEGLNHIADVVLEKSIALRKNAFLHHEYIANIYFAAKRYDKAYPLYQTACKAKPYLKHVEAKYQFCQLPHELKQTNIFGHAQDLDLIFQRKQIFYPSLGFLIGGGKK